MSTAKLKRLKAAGWKTGSARDFLPPNDEEAMLVELKLMLTDAIKASRKQRGLSQIDLARKMGSSQSRVAKIEAGDPSFRIARPDCARVFRDWRHPTGVAARVWSEGKTGCVGKYVSDPKCC